MFGALISQLDKLIGLDGESDRHDALMVETLAAFVPRMPWLYAILLVNLSGLLVSLNGSMNFLKWFGAVILAILALRLFHWVGMRGRSLSRSDATRELRNIFVIGIVMCSAYCGWTFALYVQSGVEDRDHIILFGSLAALGCSFALSPLPGAAKIPLFLLSLPLALLLISTGKIAFVGMGLTLITLIYVAMRLINAQNLTFQRLVHSRFDIELEKKRAEAAERKAINERSLANKVAETDFLTGLVNRRALLAGIEDRARQRVPIVLALIDLDGFKPINDTFGHESGDALLVTVSRRLRDLVKPPGIVARLGGDEFALLLDGNRPEAARATVAAAIARIGEPAHHDGRNLIVSACAGMASAEAAPGDPTQIIRMADMALFSAKRSGRGTAVQFSSAIENDVKRRAAIEVALRVPGVEQDIELAYQPIVDLATREVRSFEALARWRHSELGWISPSEFIPITEQISLVEQISDSLIARAAREASLWPESTQLSFNFSAVQLCSVGSAERVVGLVRESGLHPSRLQIEITETALLADFDAGRRNLSHLSRQGVNLVLDDFGAGYASISYLREMQFDAIKLDGSLITAATNGKTGLPLLKGVLDLCRAVGLPCIAEHVETAVQAATLRRLGCRYGQGFWLGRPMPAQNAIALAKSGATRPLKLAG